ncbi:MAG: hypothetical protein BroJett040_25560 [Oligoflexia bacterium]|nr:MAG: hypothetical protein BroJett040_25560 [Oligoflexia bacterium]
MRRSSFSFSLYVSITWSLLAAAFLFSGCSSADKKADTAEGAYSIAQEYDKDERYEEALRRYQDVKNKYPYSKYATMSELAVADVYFKQESFAESQVAYQSFKDLHPKHPQIDYVTYRLAMSYYNQLPSTIDRDLTLATSAILFFDEVIRQFPTSQHVSESKEKKESALKMLAEKEQYIAEFYYKREKYDSALNRFDGLLRKYSGLGLDANALSKAAISSAKIGDMDRARKYLNELNSRFPGSSEANNAAKEVK